MILTAEEIEEGAKRLVTNSLKGDWEKTTEARRRAYRAIVKDLAAQVETEHTPEAVTVFLRWMDDPKR